MAARNPSNRNLWVIAALVALSAALLAWFIGSGSLPGAGVSDISVAPPPGPGAALAGSTWAARPA